jgi:hypothetical protein
MKVEQKDFTEKISQNDKIKSVKKNDDEDFQNYIPSADFEELVIPFEPGLENLPTEQTGNAEEFSLSSLKSSYLYNVLTMDKADAEFFIDAVNKNELGLNQAVTPAEIFNLSEGSTAENVKSFEVSKTLLNMLEESMNNSKPVRIDFGNNISAVLRVDRNGKISAEFYPSDKAAEQYLKINLSFLRESLDSKSLPYGKIVMGKYRENKNTGNKRR